jgi:hypothetical protein
MKINVHEEELHLGLYPLRRGQKLIVKLHGEERWIPAVFERVSFPVIYVHLGDLGIVLGVYEMGTHWIRCRKGKHGEP